MKPEEDGSNEAMRAEEKGINELKEEMVADELRRKILKLKTKLNAEKKKTQLLSSLLYICFGFVLGVTVFALLICNFKG